MISDISLGGGLVLSVRLGVRVRLGIGFRCLWDWRQVSARRQGLASGFGIRVRLGVGVRHRGLAWCQGSASLVSLLGFGLALGSGLLKIHWGRSGFDGEYVLCLSPWEDSVLTKILLRDCLKVWGLAR